MANKDYGFFSRLLHKITLGKRIVTETSFDIEKSLFINSNFQHINLNHVYISGLARAGTTFLMNQLYKSGDFISLTYRDMPFVLAPNFWRLISSFSKKQNEMKERAHRDGVLVSSESPEALEEVFWSTFCRNQYIKDDFLIPMHADKETIENYQAYVSLILRGHEHRRYISKNNNNILRFGSICQAFPKATLLIPFRNPIQQAFSLMKQHKNFLKKHAEDPFAKQYMTWLVHHEFGSDHRPFFSEKSTIEYNTDEINYWLQLWLNTYSFIVNEIPPQGVLICYEKLCNNADDIWEKLVDRLSVSDSIIPVETWEKDFYKISPEKLSTTLHRKADDLYNKMIDNSL